MEFLCIALVIISVLVLAFIGAIHVIAIAVRGANSEPRQYVPRPQSDRDEELGELRATLRRLSGFRAADLIDEPAYQRLREHILTQQREVRFRSIAPQAPPRPEAILEALPAESAPHDPLPSLS